MKTKKVFLIVSCVYPYAYEADTKEIEKRIQETNDTISSIRKWCPDADVVLYDFGRCIPEIETQECDLFMYEGGRWIYKYAARGKGLGEAIALRRLLKQVGAYHIYYKISGRYCLNSQFGKKETSEGFNFVVYKDGQLFLNATQEYVRGASYSTRLYAVHGKEYLVKWRRSLLLAIPLMIKGISIESAMPFFIKKPINYCEKVGVQGLVAGKEFIAE